MSKHKIPQKTKRDQTNSGSSSDMLLDAFESMLFHDLMNQLTFIAYPIETISAEDNMKFSEFSGKQIVNLLQTIRYVKLVEKNELQVSKTRVSLKPLFEKSMSEFRLILEKKNQTYQSPKLCVENLYADEQLMQIQLWNIICIFTKYAPENSKFELTATVKDDVVALCLSHQASYAGDYYNSISYNNFADALLSNQGFERSIAIKLLVCKYLAQLYNSEFAITSSGGKTNFSWNIPIPAEPNHYNGIELAENKSCTLDKLSVINTKHLVERLKNIEFYKLSKINDILLEIDAAYPGESTYKWTKTAWEIVESGSKDDFISFIDNTLANFHS